MNSKHYYVPTLFHIVCVKITSHVLQDPEILQLLDKDFLIPYQYDKPAKNRNELWSRIEVIAIILLPVLPPTLVGKLLKFIRPMHFETVHWLVDNNLHPYAKGFGFNYKKLIVWRMNGTIDRVKTARNYVENERIDCIDRFIMACNYYFEDKIVEFWGVTKIGGIRCSPRRGINAAVRLWMDCLRDGTRDKVNEKARDYLKAECLEKNDIGLNIHPYYRYLSKKSRRDYYKRLCDCGPIQKQSLSLIMPELDDKEYNKLILASPIELLMRYLEWPFQFLFVEMAKHLFSSLTNDNIRHLLDSIIRFYIMYGYDYFDVFGQFWDIIPESLQREIKKEKNWNAMELILKYRNDPQPKWSYLYSISDAFYV